MKLFAMALLALSLATPSFAADEHHDVTGKDLSKVPPIGGVGGMQGGGAAPGRPLPKQPKRFEGDEGGGNLPMPKKVGDLKAGDPVKDDLGAELGKIFAFLARDFDAAGEIWVKIETPTGYKIEVRITAQAKVTGKR